MFVWTLSMEVLLSSTWSSPHWSWIQRKACAIETTMTGRALSFGVNLPLSVQLRPEPDYTVHKKQPVLTEAQVPTTMVRSVLRTAIPIARDCKHTGCCGLWCLSNRKLFPESLQVITATIALILKSRKKCRRLLSQPQRSWDVTGIQILPVASFFISASPLFCLGLPINAWGCCYCVTFSQEVGQPGYSALATWSRFVHQYSEHPQSRHATGM